MVVVLRRAALLLVGILLLASAAARDQDAKHIAATCEALEASASAAPASAGAHDKATALAAAAEVVVALGRDGNGNVKGEGNGNALGHAAALTLQVPTRASAGAVAQTPGSVLAHAREAWAVVVEAAPVGLQDAKEEARQQQLGLAPQPLSEEEAWHHWSAAQEGVVDSARLLVAFGVATSVQAGGSELHSAAARGLAAQCRELLEDPERNVDVEDAKELDGTTALHSAVSTGQLETVRLLLLDFGANVEARGFNGATPLMLAAAMGFADVARALLEAGADADARHAFGASAALHFATEMGHEAVIALLCEFGADGNARKSTLGTPLHTAADCNQTGAARALVRHCAADVHALLTNDTTPLYLAAQRGLTGLCEALVGELGARPNFEMPEGANVGAELRVAPGGSGGSGGNGDGIGSGVEDEEDEEDEDERRRRQARWYASRNTEIGNGATALHVASENGHAATVAALLRLGARASASMEGATPLVLALQYRHPLIALLLLRHGSDQLLRARVPRDGSHALLVAVDCARRTPANAEVLRLVLELAQAELAETEREREGEGEGEGGAGRSRESVVPLVDLDNGRGVTPLAHAVAIKDMAAVEALLGAGARVLASTPPASVVAAQVLDDYDSPALALLFERTAEEVAATRRRRRGQQIQEPSSTREREASPAEAESEQAREGWMWDVHPLHAAARNGHAATLRLVMELLSPSVDVRVASTGATALMLAAMGGHVRAVRALCALGANVDLRAGEALYGATALFLSAQAGHRDASRALLERGADASLALGGFGATPLLAAAERGHADVVRLLIDGDAAATGGAAAASSGAVSGLERSNAAGLTPLAAAVRGNHLDAVQALIAGGAGVQAHVAAEGVPGAAPGEAVSLVRLALSGGREVDEAIVEALLEARSRAQGRGASAGRASAARAEVDDDDDDLVESEMELLEMLRIQTSPRRHRNCESATRLLRRFLQRSTILDASVFVAVHAHEEDCAVRMLRVLLESELWKGAPEASQKAALDFQGEATGHLTPLQAAVKARKVDVVAALKGLVDPAAFRRMARFTAGESTPSAMELARQLRDYQLLKIL